MITETQYSNAISVANGITANESYNSQTESEDKTLSIFRKALLNRAGYMTHVLTTENLFSIKKQNRGIGNTINYAANLLAGAATSNTEQLEACEDDVARNLYTAIVEHPLADAIGKYKYSNQWVNSKGRLRLKSDFGYLDEVVAEGVENKSGQIPEFEIKRNRQDQRILNILTRERNNGYTGTIVKFSPTPPDYHSDEIRSRGYKGNDQISTFEINSEGKEVTTIYWLPEVDHAEYKKLAHELISLDPANSELNAQLLRVISGNADNSGIDANIMAMSNKFNPGQTERIMQFIFEKKAAIQGSENEIRYFANTRIKDQIRSQLMQEVYKASLGICKNEDVKPQLDRIYKIIEQLQFELVMYINQVTGTPLKGYNSANIEVAVEDYMKMSFDERNNYLQQADFRGSGCGFASSKHHQRYWGKSGLMTSYIAGERDQYEELEFECPHCEEMNVRERGKLIDICQNPACRKEIPRC